MKPPSLLDPASCLRLTLTLAHFLWQGAAIAVLVASGNLLLRCLPANRRYWFSVCAILLMGACPLVTFSLLAEPVQPRSVSEFNRPPISTPVPPAPAIFHETGPLFDWQRYAPYATDLYLLGVLVFVARLIFGLHGGHALRRGSQPVGESVILAALARQARALRLAFIPAIAYCQNVVGPTVVGVIRPTILLPMGILTGLSPEQVEVLLVHELAHIRRCDHLINVLQRLIEAFLFFHPGVWYVSRRIRLERENCCDDLAVASGWRPVDYATSLVRLAELAHESCRWHRLFASALGASDHPSQLRRRIRRLFESGPNPHARLGLARGLGLTFSAVLTAVVCLVAALPIVRPTARVEATPATAAVDEGLVFPATRPVVPQMTVDAQTFDFGKAMDDASIEHTFQIKNVGQTPLQIKRIRATCGCIVVNAQARTIQPAGRVPVTVRLVAKSLAGRVAKSVYVESNDPRVPSHPLTLTGEITRCILVTPSPVMLKSLNRKSPTAVEVTLTNNTSNPMLPSDATTTLANVSAVLSELTPGKQYKLVLIANPPYTGSLLRGKVTFKTGLPTRPKLTVDFFGRLPDAIEIRPSSSINLGTLNASQEYHQTVHIVSTEDVPFEIKEVNTTNRHFEPVLRNVSDGREYELEITARPPYEWGSNRASIHVGVRSPSLPTLSVQVYGEFPPPITVCPATLLFRDLSITGGGDATVDVRIVDSHSAQITSCRSTLFSVRTRLEVREPGKSYRLTATASPPFQAERLQGEVILETTHPKMKTVRVPIQSFQINMPSPEVSVIPDPVLTIPPAGRTAGPAVSRFIVRANRSEEVRVTGTAVSNREITTRIEPQVGAEDRMTFVYIAVPPKEELRPEGEILVIYTDHQAFPRITRRILRAGL